MRRSIVSKIPMAPDCVWTWAMLRTSLMQSYMEVHLIVKLREGIRVSLLCQLGNIAYRTQSGLHIDPSNGHIVGNPEAERLWSRDYEPGWQPEM